MFLNPFMLLGLAGVSVPILIHLLNKRKFERVAWAAMRFLRVSVEQNQRRIRIEDLLLLALRCLLVALLALALARPVVRGAASGLFGQSGVTSVVLLDNSYSMGATDGVAVRFDQARRAAEAAVASLPPGSSVAVFAASDAAVGIIPEPTFDLNLARKAIREAKLSDRGTNLYPAIRAAMETLGDRPAARKEIVLVTDGQRIGWRQFQEIRQTLDAARGDVHGHIVLVGAPDDQGLTQNLGVSDLRLASGAAVADQPLHFEARVTNYGAVERRDVRIALRIDKDAAPSDEATLDAIPPGGSRSAALFAKLKGAGAHTATASIGPDYLPADDSRTIALRAVAQVRVLVVDGQPGREARDSESFFLRAALVPVPREQAEGFYHKVTTINSAELESAKLDPYDVVFLTNVPDFSPATLQAIRAYVRKGGGLVVFPGVSVNRDFYNEQLSGAGGLLPARLGEPHGDPDAEQPLEQLQASGFEHPIASLWNDKAAGSPGAARFYRLFDLLPAEGDAAGPAGAGSAGAASSGSESGESKPGATPVSLAAAPGGEGNGAGSGDEARGDSPGEAGPPRVVLGYADGSPAVMERTWGRGRVVLFSSTADTDWNDLPARPNIWVPLIHRIVGAIASRQDEALNVRVGDWFIFHPPARTIGREAMIARPGDASASAARRIDAAGGEPTLIYADTSIAGGYAVSIAGDEPIDLKFAAQADAAESSLERIDAEQLASLSTFASVIRPGPDGSIEAAIRKQRVGTELWLPLAIAALALAALEIALAQWFSRSK